MADYEFTLPLFVMLPKKTKADERISLNLNTYRRLNTWTNDKAKKEYKKVVAPQFEGLIPITGRVSVRYVYWAARNNSPDLDNFVAMNKKFFQDAMSELGLIPDDNINYIVRNVEEYGGIDRDNPRLDVYITCLD